MTEDKLNYLLEPLEMHVELLAHTWEPWHLCSKDKLTIYGKTDNKPYNDILKMQTTTLDDMFKLLCKYPAFIVIRHAIHATTIVANPYFQCKSYEEALIKKDLIVV